MEISAVIITHNEADRLPAALESLQGICEEIVVVDSFSSDNTADLARAQGARVVQRAFSDYSAQKNYANSLASCPWILSLDADERLSSVLVDEIVKLKQNEVQGISGFSMPRKTWYLGRFVLHSGWYPDRKVRLFCRERAFWQGIIHERLVLEGDVKPLNGDILHYTYRDISDHVARLNRYSSLLAKGLERTSALLLMFKALSGPWITFFRHYVLKRGFLDGFAGLVIALVSAQGTRLKYLKALSAKSACAAKGNGK